MSNLENSEIKQHISNEERQKWDKVVSDFINHLGSRGVENHALADGTIAGFSEDNFTHAMNVKLAGIEENATNYHHPATHPASMITGLHSVATSGKYSELNDIPSEFHAGSGNCETINGIRITLDTSAPANPKNNKDIWFDISNNLIKYYNNGWKPMSAVYD